MSKYFSITLTILLCLAGSSLADMINGELAIAEPEGDYYETGDTVIATLILTDQNGNQLRVHGGDDNTLRGVLCWVSGPRQHFLTTEPYERHRIRTHVDGFFEDAGFNPETNEMMIILPDEIDDDGTFTVLFECNRLVNNRWYSLYIYEDFLVEDDEPTETWSYRYLTCNVDDCHNNIGQHGTTDLFTCVICHTHDYETPWHSIEHNRQAHRDEEVETCHECHRANADIDNFSEIACYTCHHPNEPEDHRNYDDDDCFPCHEEGEESDVYDVHDEFAPRQPDDFDLVFPEDDVIIEQDTVLFFWDEADDNDRDDIIIYEFQIADNRRMRDRTVIGWMDSTSIWYEGLENFTDYWWRVKVTDLNTGYKYSESKFKFTTDFPAAPSPFWLISPSGGDTLTENGEFYFETDLIWSASIDLNLDDEPQYFLTMRAEMLIGEYLEYHSDRIADTTLHVNLSELFGLVVYGRWQGYIPIEWNVFCVSGEDTVWCDSPRIFYLRPNHYSVDESCGTTVKDFSISPAFPNPFNSSLKIKIGLPFKSEVNLQVHDLSGRLVGTIVQGEISSGCHLLEFNASELPSGMYLIRYDLAGYEAGFRKVVLSYSHPLSEYL